jgi:hypothetical protein
MSKKEKLASEKIYNFLVSEYPSLFPTLDRVPRPLTHPGDEPRGPQKYHHNTMMFDRETSFKDIAELLATMNEYDEIESFKVYIDKEVIGEEERWDRWDQCNYKANVYGDPVGVTISYTADNTNYYEELEASEKLKKEWARKIEARRLREAEIKLVQQGNRELMNKARDDHRDLWISAARHLKGKTDTSWLTKKREQMMAKIAEIDELMEKISEEDFEEE